jgi:hypothetical protein
MKVTSFTVHIKHGNNEDVSMLFEKLLEEGQKAVPETKDWLVSNYISIETESDGDEEEESNWYRWKTFEDAGGKLIETESGYFNIEDAVGDASESLQKGGKIAYIELVSNDGEDADNVLTLTKNQDGQVVSKF